VALTAAEVGRRALAPFTDKAGTFAPLKAATFALVAAPGVWLTWAYLSDNLGGYPLKALLNETGLWGIRFILITLAVTPLRRILQWPKLVSVRRMIGIAAFAYSAVHLWVYVPFMAYDWGRIGSEIVLRFYLLVGTVAVLAMVPLAVTSTDAMVKRVGGARWRRLHQLVYAVGILAMLHFYLLLAKLQTPEAQILAGSLIWLLLYRLLYAWRSTMPTPWLILLTASAAELTMAAEAAFYGISSSGRIPVGAVLAANVSLESGIRPAWVIAGLGLGLALAGWIRERTSPPKERRRERLKPAVDQRS
jgi:sulfoxide reductase heme-binding subunit YedZ